MLLIYIFYKGWANIPNFNGEVFDDMCTIVFYGRISMLKRGISMRLILAVMHTTYGTFIYALVSFLLYESTFTKFCYHQIYISVLIVILILFTIECLRTIILQPYLCFMIYIYI